MMISLASLKSIAIKAVIIYLVVVVFMYVTQRGHIYFPDTSQPDKRAAGVPDIETVTVDTQDGLRLSAWYAPPSAPEKPVIVLFHGNGGNIDIRGFKARLFMREGYGILLAEYRGYGGNPGTPTEQGLYYDGEAYIEHLIHNLNIPLQNIVLYGESLGSGVATEMALRYKKVGGLILETPFTSLPDVGQHHMMFLPVKLLMKDRYNNISKIGSVEAPIFVFHGTKDRVVPTKFGRKLFEHAPDPKFMEIIEGGNHNDLYNRGAFQKIDNFIDTFILNKRESSEGIAP